MERRSHKANVEGSTPFSATYARLARLVKASGLYPEIREFKSLTVYSTDA